MRLTIATCLAACAIVFGSVGMPPAAAATGGQTAEGATTTAPAAARKRQKSKKNRVKVVPNGNAETPTQRERRLLRECKGLPNAGACLGYTR